MGTKDNKQKRFFLLILLLSIFFHVILLFLPVSLLPKKEEGEKPMMVQRIILPEDKGQVVDQITEANKERPEESKYLSEFNNKVDKETKAPVVAEPFRAPKPVPPQVAKKGEREKKEGKETELAIKEKGAAKKPTWDDLTALAPQQLPIQPQRPSSGDDYLPNVDSGDETKLNTKEFMFYTYFARIKERLRMYWTPALQVVMNRIYYGGQNMESGEFVTKVNVTLTREGNLQNVKIIQGSGNKELDMVAIQAFEKAAPFPNPPSGMIEKDGTVLLRWDFILTTNSGPSLRLLM